MGNQSPNGAARFSFRKQCALIVRSELFSAYPDVHDAEEVLWWRIATKANDDVAGRLVPLLLKKHPENQQRRRMEIPVVERERNRARERRAINRMTGGKVAILWERRKAAEEERRVVLVACCSQARDERSKTLAASLVKICKAYRQFWFEYRKLAKSVLPNWVPPEEAEDDFDDRPLFDFVLTLDELVNLELPERESIIFPFLPAQSLSMVFAPRGLGKSWFCMELALAVAEGRKFLAWDVPTIRRVLYIDGEMPQKTLVDRFKALGRGEEACLDVLPSELLWTDDRPINLNDRADQIRINELLGDMAAAHGKPDLVIIDNLSSMTAGGDENSNSELDSLLRFLISLRHKGYAIVLVHHSGKSGDQRGASRREDLLDTSIKLTQPKGDDSSSQGAKFTIEFVKTRGERPSPDKLTVELTTGKYGGLEWVLERHQTAPAYMGALAIIRDSKPSTQGAIAAALGVSAPRVTTMMQQARKAGLLSPSRLELTKLGRELVDDLFRESDF